MAETHCLVKDVIMRSNARLETRPKNGAMMLRWCSRLQLRIGVAAQRVRGRHGRQITEARVRLYFIREFAFEFCNLAAGIATKKCDVQL
jgi:hypothetical protein